MSARAPHILPILSCLLAATLWGTFWYPLRWLEAEGLPGLWATLVIYLGALAALSPWLWQQRAGPGRRHGRQQPVNLAVIALAAGWCNLAFILALLDGTVVRVLLLFYLAPMWTVLLGWMILGERPDRAAWLTLALAMSGALIMLWPARSGFDSALNYADALALSAGFAFALNNVMIRRAGRLPIGYKMLAAWLGVLGLTLVAIAATGTAVPAASAAGWIGALLFGMLVMTLMTFSAQYGVTHLPVYRSAVIFLFEIVAGAVSAWLLSDEIIRFREWLGGSLVIVAAWRSARAERSRKRLPEARVRA